MESVREIRRPSGARHRDMTGRSTVAALALAAGAIAAADLLNPQYSPVSEAVSRYVNGSAGWLVTLALVAIGAASALLAARLGRLPGGGVARRTGRTALAVWAGGVLVAAVFPADPPGHWSRPTLSEMVHGTAAMPAFVALPLAALVLAGPLGARWPAGRTALRALAAASVVTTVALAVCLVDVMDGPSLGVGSAPTLVGLVERLAIAADLAWLALAATAVSTGIRNDGNAHA
ncbi:DUF998 domain-containing protein [Streptomyces solicathayae]|uniref:DUF998 domain-containing protein n=1 Tax=Streptomyces solicathayae TaxID=3081768 RepID=A0ABZ0LKU9_9ACTN|nr:DUF998 domain-containing protein [Streptomyces sp. HUAS YS2]WOX20132.1 DUF998 domain-containing protein [Streptomyces sp. HUAS YS2]